MQKGNPPQSPDCRVRLSVHAELLCSASSSHRLSAQSSFSYFISDQIHHFDYRHPALILRRTRNGGIYRVADILPMTSRMRVGTLHRIARLRVQTEDVHHCHTPPCHRFEGVAHSRQIDSRTVAPRMSRLETGSRLFALRIVTRLRLHLLWGLTV